MANDTQLVIRAPNQNYEDYEMHCGLNWTIAELKRHLSNEYPSKPLVQDQKLIYSGRLLTDHLRLRDILRHDDEQLSAHIFHLVCKNQVQPSGPSWVGPTPVQSGGSASGSNVAPSQSGFVPPVNAVNMQFPPQANPVNAAPPMMATPNDPHYLAQMAAMQQMYSYYFTTYMQGFGMPAVGNIAAAATQNPPPVTQPRNTNEAAPARVNDIPAPIIGENVEIVQRDWLDRLFHAWRYLLFFFILYFYSSPERMLLVVLGLITVFLYNEGWFFRRNNVRTGVAQQLNRRNVQPHQEEPANHAEDPNEELLEGQEIEALMDAEEPPEPPARNIFSPFTFVSMFFSSLIPEPPPPVNIN